jgi:hypothetical protein
VGDAATRAQKQLGFDASGDLTLSEFADPGVVSISAFMETVLDDTNSQSALATLGIRLFRITIVNGTAADSIKVSAAYGVYGWNSQTIAEQDNIVKDATTGNFTLDATGGQLSIESAAFTQGTLVAVLMAQIGQNQSNTDMGVQWYVAGGDMHLIFQEVADGVGATADLTAVVDEGGGAVVRLQVLYITQNV